MSAATVIGGATLRLDVDDEGRAVLHHSDMDEVPIVLDLRVVGFYADQPAPLEPENGIVELTGEGLRRRQAGDVVLSVEEQAWLLHELIDRRFLRELREVGLGKKPE